MVTTKGPGLPDRVFALAEPVGAASVFEPGELVTAATVARYLCAEADVARAADALAGAGFEVLQRSPLFISIAGPPDLFERVFGGRLLAEEREVIKPGSVRTTGTFIDWEGAPVPGLVNAAGSQLAEVVTAVAIEEPYYPAAGPGPAEPAADPPEVGYWHLTLPDQLATALRADAAQRDRLSGAGVRVAMVDTGFQHHPFFTTRGYRVEPTVLGPGTAEPEVDENGHGTGEAANVFAAAPGATLLPVKAATAAGALVNVTAAFTAAAALQPQVITNSWGSSQPDPPLSAANQALAAAVAAAVADGVVVVFSAGNGGWGFPGQHPDVISAGGVYEEPDGSLRASDYASGFTSRIYADRRVPDVSGLVGLLPAAMYLMLPVPPGSVIDRGNAGGMHPEGDETAPDDGWAAFSGTSAAAPQLAGVCALVAEVAPGLAPDRVRQVLTSTARDVTAGTNHPTFGHPAAPGPDLATGHGLVDATAAVTAARELAGEGGVGDEGAGGGVSAVGAGAGGGGRGPAAAATGGPRGDVAVVALVLLRAGPGDPPATMSVETQTAWQPSAGTVEQVRAELVRAGFRVHHASGPTLAIEATGDVFGRTFGAEPVRAADGGWTSEYGDELPLDRLPAELRDKVHAVVLERPAQLHP